MSHRIFCLLAVTIITLLTGCVPVTEPLSDPDKAKVDMRLLGKWQRVGETNYTVVDAPAVKGHPPGLMRAVYNGKADEPHSAFWFFTTTIDKHTYATMFINPNTGKGMGFADFRAEGAYAKWHKEAARRYFVVHYVLDGDRLTVDGGDNTAFGNLMRAEKIEANDKFHKTPPQWLATYLDKNGPQAIFNGKDVQQWQRVKK
jgi:hypothetical protein